MSLLLSLCGYVYAFTVNYFVIISDLFKYKLLRIVQILTGLTL